MRAVDLPKIILVIANDAGPDSAAGRLAVFLTGEDDEDVKRLGWVHPRSKGTRDRRQDWGIQRPDGTWADDDAPTIDEAIEVLKGEE